MKAWLKNSFANILEYSGLNAFKRWLRQNSVVVLTYHGVIPRELIKNGEHLFEYRNVVTQEDFEQQIRFVRSRYIPLSVKDLFEVIGSKRKRVSRPYILITFDDGFENNYKYAFPVLKKYGVVGHFFLTTDFMGSQKMLWTEEVNYRIMHTHRKKLHLVIDGHAHEFTLRTVPEKEHASIRLRKILKLQRRSVIEEVLEELRQQTDDVATDELAPDRYRFMSWDQIREMSQSGMIFGSHTTHHFLLNNLTAREVEETLAESKRIIEQETHEACEYFSYPNGEKENFSERDTRILMQLGYKCAFTQIPGFNEPDFIPLRRYALYRINISYFMSLPIFKAIIAGTWIH
ncbi:MAG: polysaccharide deacetylase family protein [Calditrichaeota bacterium]|nr:polysaccharide deacetylase family protein [Calditrichota bacterium]